MDSFSGNKVSRVGEKKIKKEGGIIYVVYDWSKL